MASVPLIYTNYTDQVFSKNNKTSPDIRVLNAYALRQMGPGSEFLAYTLLNTPDAYSTIIFKLFCQ